MKPAIIVVSSLVARGSVGARASQFVLERLGFPVWLVPTVTLAWHPGHGRSTRIVPDPGAFATLVEDLARSPHLGEVGAVLTGYFGHPEQVEAAAFLVAAARAANPDARFFCDPVIGDHYGLFQPPGIAEAVRDRLIPHADMAKPNRHELAWLTGRELHDEADTIAAARALGPREVVVTSSFAGEGAIGNLVVTPDEVRRAEHPLQPSAPHGTGDLLSALYLAARVGGGSVDDALRRAVGTTVEMIDLAIELGTDELPLAAGQAIIAAG
ncbi:MAG: pyridoxal kinase [Rhizobiales bacterium]|nr:pyridoxal kinase [Hyphomicrobiales bacterium]